MTKKWFFAAMLGVGLLVALYSLPSTAQKAPRLLTLLYSNNINGEIEPCPT